MAHLVSTFSFFTNIDFSKVNKKCNFGISSDVCRIFVEEYRTSYHVKVLCSTSVFPNILYFNRIIKKHKSFLNPIEYIVDSLKLYFDIPNV